MSATLAAFPDRRLASFNAALSPQERERALLDGLPEPLQAALAAGATTRRSRFTDDGFDGVTEEWTPPPSLTTAQVAMARRALEELRRDALSPAAPDRLLGRVLALLSHYPAKTTAPEVEQMIALDWAEDLGEFPAWAVDQAARVWRRTRKWRPSIAEMRALCDEACRRERRLADRLALLAAAKPDADRAGGRDAPTSEPIGALAARAVRRMN